MIEYPLANPRYEREPDNAPGPFYVVKGCCILCALPPETAPENITWDEQHQRSGCVGCPNHCRIERQPETEEELSRVIEAACASCVQAIRYCGTDPGILARFQALDCGGLCDVLET